MDEHHKPVVYIISDSVGETAELVVKAAVIQFNSHHVEIRRESYIKDVLSIKQTVEEASSCNSIIVYTLVNPELRKALEEDCAKNNIVTVDLMGPMIAAISRILPITPRLEPGLVRRMDEEYFRRVIAVEFAVKYDDGKDPRGLLLADIVLIGVSRTSKTPLSMYLAHRRLKVANLPLVPEVDPPEELFLVPSGKIIGLSINPEQLQQIRLERLNALGLKAQANYASMERIMAELDYANSLMRRLGCRVFDVSNKAVEEVANKVLNIVKEEGLGDEH